MLRKNRETWEMSNEVGRIGRDVFPSWVQEKRSAIEPGELLRRYLESSPSKLPHSAAEFPCLRQPHRYCDHLKRRILSQHIEPSDGHLASNSATALLMHAGAKAAAASAKANAIAQSVASGGAQVGASGVSLSFQGAQGSFRMAL